MWYFFNLNSGYILKLFTISFQDFLRCMHPILMASLSLKMYNIWYYVTKNIKTRSDWIEAIKFSTHSPFCSAIIIPGYDHYRSLHRSNNIICQSSFFPSEKDQAAIMLWIISSPPRILITNIIFYSINQSSSFIQITQFFATPAISL